MTIKFLLLFLPVCLLLDSNSWKPFYEPGRVFTGSSLAQAVYEDAIQNPTWAGAQMGRQPEGQMEMHTGPVKFYVDPHTISDDPETRMTYGLNIIPPWPNGGSVFVNLPEHLEYMPGTKGIARHHDNRKNVWQVNGDSAEAQYEVESITEPGVFFSVKARGSDIRAIFEMTISNRSKKVLQSIRPLLCFQYNLLKGFPLKDSDNFEHTFIVINGEAVAVERCNVLNPTAVARMAQVIGCPDEHNWWAEKMGGFIEKKLDGAYTILTAKYGERKVILHWTPGKNFLSNTVIPCIHADPCIGELAPGESRSVQGELIFTEVPLKQLLKEFPIK